MPSKVEWANLERVMEMVYKTRFLGAKHKIGRHQETSVLTNMSDRRLRAVPTKYHNPLLSFQSQDTFETLKRSMIVCVPWKGESANILRTIGIESE